MSTPRPVSGSGPRVARVVAVVALLAVLVGAGAAYVLWQRGKAPGPGGPLTTDGGATFSAAFPDYPRHDQIPNAAVGVRGFFCEQGGNQYAAWTESYTDEQLNDAEFGPLLGGLANSAGGRGGGAISYSTGDFDGLPMATTNGELVDQRRYKTGDWGSVQVVLAGNTAYVLRVFGPGAKPDAPHVKAFFASLTIPNRPPAPPPLAPPPDDDLRLLTRIDPTTAVAFAPDAKAVFTCTVNEAKRQEWENSCVFARNDGKRIPPPPGLLKRYSYPEFQPLPACRIPTPGYRLLADEPRKRLFLAAFTGGDGLDVHRQSTADPVRAGDLHVYDLDKLPKDGGDATPERVIEVGGFIRHLSHTPDGKHLLALVSHPHPPAPDPVIVHGAPPHPAKEVDLGRAVLMRFDADTLAKTGQLVLHGNTESLCRVPGTATYYAAATLCGHKFAHEYNAKLAGEFQQIDMAAFQVTRTFRAKVDPFQAVATPDGKLLVTGGSNQSQPLTVIDPTGKGDPVVRRIPGLVMNTHLQLSPDSTRLYCGKTGYTNAGIVCWDVQEATAHHRRREIGVYGEGWSQASGKKMEPPRVNEATGGVATISADGKCLITRTGLVFWLTGAGLLPAAPAPAK